MKNKDILAAVGALLLSAILVVPAFAGRGGSGGGSGGMGGANASGSYNYNNAAQSGTMSEGTRYGTDARKMNQKRFQKRTRLMQDQQQLQDKELLQDREQLQLRDGSNAIDQEAQTPSDTSE